MVPDSDADIQLCIVDNRVVGMGGLDLCFGRYDTHDHPLADVHPTHFELSLFPGQGELLTDVEFYVLIIADYNSASFTLCQDDIIDIN